MDAMSESTLTATQRYVVLCLARYANHKNGRNARPTVRTLADDAAVHTETVMTALAAAEQAGLIEATARAHRRPTVWAILPEPGVRVSRTPVSGSAGQPCPASVRHLSGSTDSTTETTTSTDSSSREEKSVSPPTLTTNGRVGEEHISEIWRGLSDDERAFGDELLPKVIAGAPTSSDRDNVAAFARMAVRNKVTVDDVLSVVRDPRPAALVKNASLIVLDAKRAAVGR